jgi:hypothetical protein
MRIDKVSFRNFGSYGNKTITLDIPQEPGFFLVQGKNGNGKCLLPSTNIKITCESKDFDQFIRFLEIYRSKE